jgi:hypothetical protein
VADRNKKAYDRISHKLASLLNGRCHDVIKALADEQSLTGINAFKELHRIFSNHLA